MEDIEKEADEYFDKREVKTKKETTIKLESLTVMSLKPDDILVLKLDDPNPDRVEYLYKYLKQDIGVKNDILFLASVDDIAAIRKDKE